MDFILDLGMHSLINIKCSALPIINKKHFRVIFFTEIKLMNDVILILNGVPFSGLHCVYNFKTAIIIFIYLGMMSNCHIKLCKLKHFADGLVNPMSEGKLISKTRNEQI